MSPTPLDPGKNRNLNPNFLIHTNTQCFPGVRSSVTVSSKSCHLTAVDWKTMRGAFGNCCMGLILSLLCPLCSGCTSRFCLCLELCPEVLQLISKIYSEDFGAVSQWAKCLLNKLEKLSLVSSNPCQRWISIAPVMGKERQAEPGVCWLVV